MSLSLGPQVLECNWYYLIRTGPQVPGVVPYTSSRVINMESHDFFEENIREGGGPWKLFREWRNSDQYLRAPVRWPDRVERAFVSAPSPFEFSYAYRKFVPPGGYSNAKWGYHWMVAYAHGMDLDLLSKFLSRPVTLLVDQMEEAARVAGGRGAFLVWCLNVDWTLARVPPEVSASFLERVDVQDRLQNDFFSVPIGILGKIVESQRLISYAVHAAPKRVGFRPKPHIPLQVLPAL